MRIVLFNGPPKAGKDTIVKQLITNEKQHFAFAHILKERTCAFFQTEWPWPHYEDSKDIPMEEFEGMSPRQAYIWMSEKVIKPKFGEQWFGHQLVKKLELYDDPGDIVFVSDHGFTSEGFPLAERFGSENMCIVRLNRDGTSFENDSRSWVHTYMYQDVLKMRLPHTILATNNGRIVDTASYIKMKLGEWFLETAERI